MNLIQEINRVLIGPAWPGTAPGIVLVAVPRSIGLTMVKAKLEKLRVYKTPDWKKIAIHPEDGPMTPDEQADRYFSDLTGGWANDYAFVLRYDDQPEGETMLSVLQDEKREPRVVALVDRWSPTDGRFLYLTGGIGSNRKAICAGDMMARERRPRGYIRRLLFLVGIKDLEVFCGDGHVMHKGSMDVGYTFEPHEDGRVRGTLRLTAEDLFGDPVTKLPITKKDAADEPRQS